MKVPNEILLDILHPLDYSSLLRLKFTASRFYHLIARDESNLPKRHHVALVIWPSVVRLEVDDDVIFAAKYASTDSFEAALTAAKDIVGLHPIVSVKLYVKAIVSGLAEMIFECLPAATYASDVRPYCVTDIDFTRPQLEAFIARFPNLCSVGLEDTPVDFDWTILRSKYFLRIPSVRISPETFRFGNVHFIEAAVDEIIRFCCDFTELPPAKTK
ncbi:hypothetical protein AAVH_14578 [Aphelenchoides avenae]|nr:hypothetical protein AAVH_14578 [Aphelenchus avenae]